MILVIICCIVLFFCVRWLYADYSVHRKDKLIRQHKLCAEFTAVWLEMRSLLERKHNPPSLLLLSDFTKESGLIFEEQFLKYKEDLSLLNRDMDFLSSKMELIRNNPEWNQDLFVRKYFPMYRDRKLNGGQ